MHKATDLNHEPIPNEFSLRFRFLPAMYAIKAFLELVTAHSDFCNFASSQVRLA